MVLEGVRVIVADDAVVHGSLSSHYLSIFAVQYGISSAKWYKLLENPGYLVIWLH